jgi:hypothetical protein
MATRPFTTDGTSVDGVRPAVYPQAASRVTRYQLQVIAADMADVVQSVGGWLCDRARAGWDVSVLVADQQDDRPLSILGATTLAIDAEAGSLAARASRGGALAISAAELGTNMRLRDDVLRLLRRGLTEVVVWGDEWPAELGRRVDPVQHRMSCAARAFKAHALGAAAVSHNSIAAAETLFPIGTAPFRPLYSV